MAKVLVESSSGRRDSQTSSHTAAQTFSEYDDFAWLYDRYWGNNFTKPALAMLRRSGALKQRNTKGTILDLCCGTGQLSRLLSQKGYRVIGIDGSEKMLQYARKNAPGCEFILADARNFSLDEPVDVTVSAYDSLNHILSIKELKRAFKNVHASLKDRGLFVFDLNMEEGFKARWRGSFGLAAEDHAAVLRSDYNRRRRVGRMVITIFFSKTGKWSRSDITLQERCYPEDQVKSALRECGFGRVDSYDFQRDLKLPEVGRVFFVCRK